MSCKLCQSWCQLRLLGLFQDPILRYFCYREDHLIRFGVKLLHSVASQPDFQKVVEFLDSFTSSANPEAIVDYTRDLSTFQKYWLFLCFQFFPQYAHLEIRLEDVPLIGSRGVENFGLLGIVSQVPTWNSSTPQYSWRTRPRWSGPWPRWWCLRCDKLHSWSSCSVSWTFSDLEIFRVRCCRVPFCFGASLACEDGVLKIAPDNADSLNIIFLRCSCTSSSHENLSGGIGRMRWTTSLRYKSAQDRSRHQLRESDYSLAKKPRWLACQWYLQMFLQRRQLLVTKKYDALPTANSVLSVGQLRLEIRPFFLRFVQSKVKLVQLSRLLTGLKRLMIHSTLSDSIFRHLGQRQTDTPRLYVATANFLLRRAASTKTAIRFRFNSWSKAFIEVLEFWRVAVEFANYDFRLATDDFRYGILLLDVSTTIFQRVAQIHNRPITHVPATKYNFLIEPPHEEFGAEHSPGLTCSRRLGIVEFRRSHLQHTPEVHSSTELCIWRWGCDAVRIQKVPHAPNNFFDIGWLALSRSWVPTLTFSAER